MRRLSSRKPHFTNTQIEVHTSQPIKMKNKKQNKTKRVSVKQKDKKGHQCPVCAEKLARKHNVTLHMRTQHSDRLLKVVCPNKKCAQLFF